VIKSLLQTYLPTIIQKYKAADAAATISFKIDIKRRLCSHLTRDQVIEAITPILLGSDSSTEEEDPEKKYGCKFSVNLSNPDFAIRIEIIKTLCGISILPREEWYKNFNVAELIDAKDNNDENN
jgi:tRNA(Ser,Leu) C12 N-acetylase TAN1